MLVIIQRRWFGDEPVTLKELREELGVSAQSCRQLEIQLLWIFRRGMTYELYVAMKESDFCDYLFWHGHHKVRFFERQTLGLHISDRERVRSFLNGKLDVMTAGFKSRERELAPQIVERKWLALEPLTVYEVAQLVRSTPTMLDKLEYRMLWLLKAATTDEERKEIADTAFHYFLERV